MQYEIPTCNECGEEIHEGDNRALNEGVDVCDECFEDWSEEKIEKKIKNKREMRRVNSGIQCEVCGKNMLRKEARNVKPDLCEEHTIEDLKEKRKYMEERREEEMKD